MRSYEQDLGYSSTAAGRSGLVAGLLDVLARWHERARSRRHLAALSDYMLRDVGIDRGLAAREADKPFWKP